MTRNTSTRKRGITIALLMLALALYQAPNLALLAHKAGLPLVATDLLGVEVKVQNGWYPVVSSESLLGRAVLPAGGPSLVAFHRPSLICPWRGDIFMVMAYPGPVDAGAVDSTKEVPWGRALLIKANLPGNPRRLFAVPQYGIGVLADDQRVLNDIQTLAKATRISTRQ